MCLDICYRHDPRICFVLFICKDGILFKSFPIHESKTFSYKKGFLSVKKERLLYLWLYRKLGTQ